MMTSMERGNPLLCLCLVCVAPIDDTSFPQTWHCTLTDTWLFIRLSAAAHLHHKHSHTPGQEGTEGGPVSRHITEAPGFVKDDVANRLCLVCFSFPDTIFFVCPPYFWKGHGDENWRKCWCQRMAYFSSERGALKPGTDNGEQHIHSFFMLF